MQSQAEGEQSKIAPNIHIALTFFAFKICTYVSLQLNSPLLRRDREEFFILWQAEDGGDGRAIADDGHLHPEVRGKIPRRGHAREPHPPFGEFPRTALCPMSVLAHAIGHAAVYKNRI
jgi:hypothetical protein